MTDFSPLALSPYMVFFITWNIHFLSLNTDFLYVNVASPTATPPPIFHVYVPMATFPQMSYMLVKHFK